VTVPFTTPLLTGARVRGAIRGGSELIVPNPSGLRGDYVLAWDGLDALCRPTVHDQALAARLRTLAELTPYTVRECAWDVASQGFAGPEARAAAEAARAADRHARIRANTALLRLLVAQSGRATSARVTIADLRAADLQRRRRSGAEAGIAGDGLAMVVNELAELFAPIGIGPEAEAARLPRLLHDLGRLHRETLRFALMQRGAAAERAHGIVDAAAAAVRVRAVLDAAGGLTEDMLALIGRCIADPDGLARELMRPAWLLDGWEPLVLIWTAARGIGEQREALAQMVSLRPVLPQEATGWLADSQSSTGSPQHRWAGFAPPEPAQEVAAFERIARNEELRAMAA